MCCGVFSYVPRHFVTRWWQPGGLMVLRKERAVALCVHALAAINGWEVVCRMGMRNGLEPSP